MTARSPLTVNADVVSPDAIELTAGETADAPGFADDLTISPGVRVESTGSTVSLLAGDDVILGAGAVVRSFGDLVVTVGSGDLDGGGTAVLDGALVSTGSTAVLSIGDVTMGQVVASAGAAITSTQGSILDGNGILPNLVANGRSVLSAARVIGLPSDSLEVQVSNGQLVTNAAGAVDRVSVNLRGQLDPHERPFATLVPPGLVLFNNAVFGGDSVDVFESYTAERNIRSTGERDHGRPGFFTGSMLYLDEVWSPDALYEWDATLEQGPVSQR